MFHSAIFKGAVFKLFLLMAIMLIIVVAVISKMNEIQTKSSEKLQGNLTVSIKWPDGDLDVDLWVFGPGEVLPVGYSNLGGNVWNLVRDDLGNTYDNTMGNFETAFSRGVKPGEYTFNVHCFRCVVLMPVPVEMEIRLTDMTKVEKAETKVIWRGKILLKKAGQEKTAVTFNMLDEKGNIDRETMNNVFKPLREAKK